jgi:flavin-dependent dehydrogenase
MSSEIDSLDVVIIGGGVAGLSTAALLARSGKAVAADTLQGISMLLQF